MPQSMKATASNDGIWSIFFNTVLLAKLDERDYIIRGEPARTFYRCCRFTPLPISPVAHSRGFEVVTPTSLSSGFPGANLGEEDPSEE